jgi:hypothetical protein
MQTLLSLRNLDESSDVSLITKNIGLSRIIRCTPDQSMDIGRFTIRTQQSTQFCH